MAQYWPLYTYYRSNDLSRKNVYARISAMRKALSDLRLQSAQREMEVTAQKEELRTKHVQIRDDVQEEAESRLTALQEKVNQQADELLKLGKENRELVEVLQKYELQKCKVNGLVVLRQDSEMEDESAKGSARQQTQKEQSTSELERRLSEAEEKAKSAQDRADHMTLLLNQKLIELNKLQLTLSNQTKDMIQLEKAYFQLRCHLGKNYRSPSSPSSRSSRIDLVS